MHGILKLHLGLSHETLLIPLHWLVRRGRRCELGLSMWRIRGGGLWGACPKLGQWLLVQLQTMGWTVWHGLRG